MNRVAGLRHVLGALCLAVLGGIVGQRLEVSTALVHFLDDGTERELARISRSLLDSPLTRTMILSIEAGDRARSLAAADELAAALRAHPEVAEVRAGPPEGAAEAAYALYFPHRLALLSSDPERELSEQLSDEGLQEAARALLRELSRPTADLVKRVAPQDPLLAFPTVARRLERTRGGPLEVVDGRFVSGSAALLFAKTRHSALDSSAQQPLDAYLSQRLAELERAHGPDLRVERSSAHRFAAASARRAQAEAGLLSGVSVGALVLLFALVFRSLRALLAAFVPLVAGVLAATGASLLAFGQLHVLTLVFGSTLIGVCIDYPIHVLTCHALAARPGGAPAVMRRVRLALVMGAGTTIAGFAGIGASGMPGVREVGVFAAVGVLAALLATLFWLPWLVPGRLAPWPGALGLARRLLRRLGTLAKRRRPLWVLPALGIGILGTGLPQVAWLDDVFALNVPGEPEWLAEERRVRERVSRMDTGRFIVAIGSDTEQALVRNDRLFLRLERLRDRGVLEGFSSLHPFLFSAELQRRNLAVFRSASDLEPRIEEAFADAGFRPGAFEAFAASLRELPREPLELEDLLGSPLRDLVEAFRVELDDRVAILSLVRGVSEATVLAESLRDLEGVYFFDQRSFLGELYGRYRQRTMGLVAGGLLAVFALLVLRYRGLWLALCVVAPALFAATITLALLALAGVPINLLHLLGLLLVLSIGVDYSIFLVEARGDGDHVAATLLCLGIACASTLLAFGLLAFSSFPALRALGSATAIGVLGCLVLAPSVLVLVGHGSETPDPAREG